MEIQKDAFTDEEKAVNFKRGGGTTTTSYNPSMKFQTVEVIQCDRNKAKDYCALCERCFQEKN